MLSLVLRILRIANGDFTIKETAEKLKLSSAYISEIETQKKKPTLSLLEKYSKAYDILPSRIVKFDEEDEKSGIEDPTRRYQISLLRILKYYLEDEPKTKEESKSKS